MTPLVVVLVPGTGVVYTISSTIAGGWRRGTFASVGSTLGIVPHILGALIGLSGVIQAGAAAFEVMRWAGVSYLLFMGVSMVREGGALQVDDKAAATDSLGQVVWRGILVNLLNPKLTVFFFAFLPQFLDTPPGPLDMRLVGLGAVFMLMTLAVFLVYAWVSAAVSERVLGAPAVVRRLRRSLGNARDRIRGPPGFERSLSRCTHRRRSPMPMPSSRASRRSAPASSTPGT